ncbi:SWIM zinc finger family protein [Streptomyces sp. TR06-5]|uniref:SWIM zinc finger family protein n=1 Tax=unclassified Streptomyces TaxID=2593676 RepID=UPI0039A0162F
MAVAFTAGDLRELAGDAGFERGERCVAAVSELRLRDGELRAVVSGTEPYRVWLDVRTLDGDCECPHADEGAFCKHLVAVGLTELGDRNAHFAQDEGDGAAPEDEAALEEDLESLYGYLSDLPRSTLVDLLLDAAEEDAWLRDRLLDRESRGLREYR